MQNSKRETKKKEENKKKISMRSSLKIKSNAL